MKILFFLILCFLSLYGAIQAQLPTKLNFKNITNKEGLPEKSINSIFQDSRGFMWFGSKEGLIRYDGKNFKTWYSNTNDSNYFQSNNIIVHSEFKPNQILFTSGNDLFFINSINLKIQPIASFKNKILFSSPIKVDKHWVLTTPDSLYITDQNLNISKALSLSKHFKPKAQVISFKLNGPYVMLFAVIYNKHCILNIETNEILSLNIDIKLNELGPVLVPKLFMPTSNKLYLCNYFDGWFSMNLNIPNQLYYKPVKETAITDGSCRTVLNYKNKFLIGGGEGGLFISDFKNEIKYVNDNKYDKSLLDNIVLAIYEDPTGKIWLGTYKGISVFEIKAPAINYKTNNEIFANDNVKDIVKGADNNIYLLMQNKSLIKFNNDFSFTQLDKSIGYTWNAIKHNTYIYAVGGGKKIVAYDVVSQNTTNPSFLKPFYDKADLVTLVFKANNGDIWYSINAGGGLVHYIASTQQYKHYTSASSPPFFSHRHLNCAAQDSKGNMWFGYIRNPNLLKWDASTNSFQEFEISKLIKQYKTPTGIKNIFIDKNDNLWIALDALGVIKYNINTKTGAYYNISNGLPTSDVWAFETDNKNRIWITTQKGICYYDPINDKISTFTVNDGLPEDDNIKEGIFYDNETNLLYLAGQKALAWFNPESLVNQQTTKKPLIYIDEFLVNSKPFYFNENEKIILQPNEDNLQVNIAAVDYISNQQLEFQYQLIGANNKWIDIGSSRTINFNNIKPGNYILNVRGRYKGANEWHATNTPIAFKISTPWYSTWWFVTLLLLSIAALTYYFINQYYQRKIRAQQMQIEKQNAIEIERNRIAADMHDDLGSGLTRINYATQMLMNKEVNNKDLVNIRNISTTLVESMREIIWAMKEENNSLEELILYIKNYMVNFCADYHLAYKLNLPNHIPTTIIKGQHRRTIFLTIKEILHNVVKHANANEVKLTIKIEPNHWIINIKDNGVGNTNINDKKGNGIRNIQQRIASINGKVTFNNLENGLAVELWIPC